MVVSGTNILYFYPEEDLLFVGDIYRKGGQSITAAKRQEIASKLVNSLPLDKAVKIGAGPRVVIEFTDPDCPYCKKASEFFKNRTDVTRYVFFAPFAHPQAITKIHYILNARDKAHAYHEMMENKTPSQPPGGYGEAIKSLAQEHLNLARKVGVQGTPTFFIGGTQVVGADVGQLERLLKNDKALAK
jgi:thiol:disulfide interchange protein DsbC